MVWKGPKTPGYHSVARGHYGAKGDELGSLCDVIVAKDLRIGDIVHIRKTDTGEVKTIPVTVALMATVQAHKRKKDRTGLNGPRPLNFRRFRL